jgi:hypothetical protein
LSGHNTRGANTRQTHKRTGSNESTSSCNSSGYGSDDGSSPPRTAGTARSKRPRRTIHSVVVKAAMPKPPPRWQRDPELQDVYDSMDPNEVRHILYYVYRSALATHLHFVIFQERLQWYSSIWSKDLWNKTDSTYEKVGVTVLK